jgi:ectoine hydroxylase-related dioxygenase (phytanoyl-CoA dioxygenase family)
VLKKEVLNMTMVDVSTPLAVKRAKALSLVTDDVVATFKRDGAVWIPGLLSESWMRLIAQGVERVHSCPGPLVSREFAGQPGEYYNAYGNYAVIPEFQRLLADSPIVDVVAKILRAENLWLFLDQIFVKEGGYSKRTAWHQDIPWLMADGAHFATIWIALQPLKPEETLEFVAGSHLGPIYDHFVEGIGNDMVRPIDGPKLPDIEAARDDWPIVTHANQPGDVMIFHPQTLHGGAEMRGGDRRSLNMRFFGERTVYVEREAGHNPNYPGVSEAHQPGDLLRHPWFPQVYPRLAAA